MRDFSPSPNPLAKRILQNGKKSLVARVWKAMVTVSPLLFHQNSAHVTGECGSCAMAMIIKRMEEYHGELLHNCSYLDFDPNKQFT